MKDILLIAAAIAVLFLFCSAFGLTIEPTVEFIRAGDVSFAYPHPLYGNQDGKITAKTGEAYGLEVKQLAGRWVFGLSGQYLSVPIRQTTVGGQPKNWGDSAQGWAAFGTVGYRVSHVGGWEITPTIGVGYQDLLGGGSIAQVGIEASKPIGKRGVVSLTANERWAQSTNYEGLTMHKEPSLFFGAKIGWKF